MLEVNIVMCWSRVYWKSSRMSVSPDASQVILYAYHLLYVPKHCTVEILEQTLTTFLQNNHTY